MYFGHGSGEAGVGSGNMLLVLRSAVSQLHFVCPWPTHPRSLQRVVGSFCWYIYIGVSDVLRAEEK